MSKIIDLLRKSYLIGRLTKEERIDIDENMELSSDSKKIVKYTQLEKYLHEKRIPKKYYSIGKDKEDSICITFENIWVIYYSERGERRIFLETFSEVEACQNFLLTIKKTIATDTGRDSIYLYENL